MLQASTFADGCFSLYGARSISLTVSSLLFRYLAAISLISKSFVHRLNPCLVAQLTDHLTLTQLA